MSNADEPDQCQKNARQCSGPVLILAMVGVYIGYIFLGAVMFMAIEQRGQAVSQFLNGVEQDHEAVKRAKEGFLENHPNVSREELEQIVQSVFEATQMNVDPRGNATPSNNWNGFSAVIFTTSVVTTIGFGNVTPQTPLGQVVCILYAILGIPLNFTVLGLVGKKVQKLHEKIAQKMTKNPKFRQRLRYILGIVLGGTLSIFLPALFYCWIEGWTYLQSVYFCFITISTIGFGDFYPSSDAPRKPGTGYYFLFLCSILWGMVWISTAFNIVQATTCKIPICCHARTDTPELKNGPQRSQSAVSLDEAVALQETLRSTGSFEGERASSLPFDHKHTVEKRAIGTRDSL